VRPQSICVVSCTSLALHMTELLRILSSRLRLSQNSGFDSMGASSRKSSQARLLCFVVTAIAKLATCHSELLLRAHVSLSKVPISVRCVSIVS
jgi:hypothetical protein